MESILKTFLIAHLLLNKLITPFQHGFLANRSTLTNLLSCVTEWSKHVDNRDSIDVLYIDIAKAFDSVSHAKLLCKLEKYGIGGLFLAWIRSFLQGRRQMVKIPYLDPYLDRHSCSLQIANW